jgi:L-gulono-1,4-lactone dehydrogenase
VAVGAGRWRNWGRNQTCEPAAVERPTSELEVVEAVQAAAMAGQTVKVVGRGHSFTDIACTTGRLLHIDDLDRVIAVDREAGTVTVEAGIALWKLNHELAVRGLALPNLGDIDRQTLAGALSTGTHGTGARFGGLATFVRGMEIVTATGEVLRCSPLEEPEVFACARVGLGALGVVTKYTLQCQPAFRLHSLEKPRSLDSLLADFDEIIDANEHVDSYWWPHTDVCTVKTNNRTAEPVRVKSAYKMWRDQVLLSNYVFGAVCALGKVRPQAVPQLMRFTASQLGKTELVDQSYRVFCSPRLVRFVEMEYALPRVEIVKTLLRIRELIDGEGLRVAFPVELRVTAADDIPLSTANGRESAYIAVHLPSGISFEPYFRGVEAIMDDVGGRPHWGKMHFQTAATLEPRYPEWGRFRAVRAKLDPDGRFRNAYLDRVLGPPT